jgi:hypothetical protein
MTENINYTSLTGDDGEGPRATLSRSTSMPTSSQSIQDQMPGLDSATARRRARTLTETGTIKFDEKPLPKNLCNAPDASGEGEGTVEDITTKLERRAVALLRALDVDGDGQISFEEFAYITEKEELLLGPELYNSGQTLQKYLDPDDKGVLDMDEFWALLRERIQTDAKVATEWLDTQWSFVKNRGAARSLTRSRTMEKPNGRFVLPGLVRKPSAAKDLEGAWSTFCHEVQADCVTEAFNDLCRLLLGKEDPIAAGNAATERKKDDPFWFMNKLTERLGGFSKCVPALQTRLDVKSKHLPLVDKGRFAVIGAGPCALRAAVEAALLGAELEIFELRSGFHRMNILKLWAWVTEDLLSLGAKTLLPAFLVYQDHIGIRELQALLLKICLLLGVKMNWSTCFKDIERAKDGSGAWEVVTEAVTYERIGSKLSRQGSEKYSRTKFSAVIAGDGVKSPVAERFEDVKRVRADGSFEEPEFDIAVVANFHHARQVEDRAILEAPRGFTREEVKGTRAVIYLQGETHYFIMTPTKQALANAGIFKDMRLPIVADSKKGLMSMLDKENVRMEKLEEYVREVAESYTEKSREFHEGLEIPLEFWQQRHIANDPNGAPALMVFPFHVSLLKITTPIKVLEGNFPVVFVGDVLQEPFWPHGEGCSRGFIGALDSVYSLTLWAAGDLAPELLLAERLKLFDLQCHIDPLNAGEDMLMPYLIEDSTASTNLTGGRKQKGRYSWTVDPVTRYRSLAEAGKINKIRWAFSAASILLLIILVVLLARAIQVTTGPFLAKLQRAGAQAR